MKVVWNLKWRKALSAFIIGICLIVLPKVPLSAAAAEGTEGPDLTRRRTFRLRTDCSLYMMNYLNLSEIRRRLRQR